ncbi:MAG TPA: hypothetical protein PKX19_08505 [Bacillota bacterium]|jgi:hypothetical protein|nr:hypothetical protein [Bacillota bacterium]HQD06804.1 hypothetical protein [Bacillota bacterium]
MSDFLLVLPLLVTLALLLPPFRAHVIVAGFVGGILAMLIGGLDIGQATGLFTEGVTRLFGIAPVILFASTSIVLARAGSMRATLSLLNKGLKGKVEYIAPAMVIVQALAVYAAGSGAANTLVTAPLLFAAIGFDPYVLGGLSIASAGAWACSPSAAETAFISEAMNMSVTEYVTFMRPYAVVLWILGAVIAYIGVVKAKKAGTIRPGYSPEADNNVEAPTETENYLGDADVADWRRSLPFFVLLILLVISPVVNRLLGIQLLTTFTIPFIVLILVGLLSKINFNDLSREFVAGSKTILGYLFMVGVFLGFINMLTEIGTFEVIARLPGSLPVTLIGIGALVVAFLIAIPAAAYTTAVLIITVPIMQAIGIPTVMFGFMTLIVAQGAMISPVQVNVAASAHGFRISILRVVSNNLRFIPIAALLVIIMSQICMLLN